MRKIPYNKLVRDNIPDILDELNIKCQYRYLTDEKEIVKYLVKKVLEEAKEIVDAYQNKGDLIEEINDISLVLEELQYICFKHVSVDEVTRKAVEKDCKKGKFNNYVVLEVVEYED